MNTQQLDALIEGLSKARGDIDADIAQKEREISELKKERGRLQDRARKAIGGE